MRNAVVRAGSDCELGAGCRDLVDGNFDSDAEFTRRQKELWRKVLELSCQVPICDPEVKSDAFYARYTSEPRELPPVNVEKLKRIADLAFGIGKGCPADEDMHR